MRCRCRRHRRFGSGRRGGFERRCRRWLRRVGREEPGETVSPNIVSARRTALFSVGLQVVGDLLRSVAGIVLLDQSGKPGDVGGCLARSGEPAVVSIKESRVVRSDRATGYAYDVGLDPSVRCGALAAVTCDSTRVPVVGRAHCEHAGIVAFGRAGYAAANRVVLKT